MKAISIKPKLNAAFKVVQPLPVLTDTVPVDLRHTAAPRFDITWRAMEATRNPARAASLDAVENGVAERRRRRLSSPVDLRVAQSCATKAALPSHECASHASEVRLTA